MSSAVQQQAPPWFRLAARSVASDGQRLFSATIPAGSPFFDGHFPGRPVVPGIAFLGLVEAAALAREGRDPADDQGAVGLRRVRFRKIVERGGEVSICLRPGRSGRRGDHAFGVMMHGDSTCTGHIEIEKKPNLFKMLEAKPGPRGPDDLSRSVLDRVPHGGRMLLLDRVAEAEMGRCVTLAAVDRSWPLTDEHGCSGLTLVEVLAQSASALIAWELLDDPKSDGHGFLVGIPRATFFASRVPCGTGLRAEITSRLRMDNYATFAGTVHSEGQLLAELELQAIRP